jgi:hypothetical protein
MEGAMSVTKIFIATKGGSLVAAFTNKEDAMDKCLALAKQHSEKEKRIRDKSNTLFDIQEVDDGYVVFVSYYKVECIDLYQGKEE